RASPEPLRFLGGLRELKCDAILTVGDVPQDDLRRRARNSAHASVAQHKLHHAGVITSKTGAARRIARAGRDAAIFMRIRDQAKAGPRSTNGPTARTVILSAISSLSPAGKTG